MSLSKKLSAAALAGLMGASVVTAGAAFAAEHEKAACNGKDKAAAEANKCKGEAKEAASCTGKDKEKEANKCKGEKKEGEQKH